MSTDESLVGKVLGRKYELVRLLGQGGMGAVYEARNHLGKRVAVKLLLKPGLAHDPVMAARFTREAKATAAIESKHIVDVYDSGLDEETRLSFIIMEYLGGEDLEHLIRRVGPVDPLAAARVAAQSAAGLAKAHAGGIVHRDIKPANLFLAEEEGDVTVKVLDFGIAKLSVEAFSSEKMLDAGITSTGSLIGTPTYMSPEQAQGLKTIDARTDVWSLGMCLYHALTARMPFDEVDTIGKLIVAIVSRELTPLRNFAPWVPEGLALAVHRALERDLARRIGSAKELISLLGPYTQGSTTVTRTMLSGVRHSLDFTPSSGAYDRASIDDTVAASTNPRAIERTTAATSVRASAPGPADRQPATPSARPRLLGAALLALIVAIASGVFVLRRNQGGGRADAGSNGAPTPPASTASVATASASTPSAPPAAAPTDLERVGVLDVKVPSGCVVKVSGIERKLEDGKLTLRGQYNQKFVVGVYDKSGRRIMSQEVYLYDGVLDPPAIDTTVGEVYVTPKAKPAGATTGAAAKTSASAPPSQPPNPATSNTKPLPAGASSDF